MSGPLDDFGPPEPIAKAPVAPALTREEFDKAYADAQKRLDESGKTGGAESFLSKAAQSVPVLGAAYNKGVAALDSLSPFFASRHLERGEGDYQPRTYEQALTEQQALMEQRAKEHQGLTTAAKFAGPALGYAALPVSAFASVPAAAATSAGVEGLDAAARGESGSEILKRALWGGVGGGAGQWVGGKIFNRLGRGADKASTEAVTGGTQSAVAKLDDALGSLHMTEPGARARFLREAGIAGGIKSPKGVESGVKNAVEQMGEKFGGLIDSAQATGTRVPISSARAEMTGAAKEFQANDFIDKVIEKHLGYLEKHADTAGTISHKDLQGVLSELRPTASRIFNKAPHTWTPQDEAFVASYRALRRTQDEGLSAALGENAKDVRRYSAIFHDVLPIAEKAVHRSEGNHPVGLIGELRKGSGARDMAIGAAAAATGSPAVGAGLVLKGALGWLGGQFGKATAPYRANVLTSVLSGAQRPLAGALERGIPQSIGATLAGGPPDAPAADDFGPPEPIPALVAKRGK